LVSAKSLSCVGPLHALPDVAFPPVGRLGLTSPPSSVLCDATTAAVSLSGRFACRSLPDTLPASVVRGIPDGLVARRKLPVTPGPVVTRSPTPGIAQGDTWLSQVPEFPLWRHAPLSDPGGVLHPRHIASRTAAFRRLHTVGFPLDPALRDILLSTTIHISGLNHAACLLATPGFVRPLAGRHASSLLTCWLDVSQVGFTPTGKQQPISWVFTQSQGFGLTLARAGQCQVVGPSDSVPPVSAGGTEGRESSAVVLDTISIITAPGTTPATS
jgi:hypothetical protein